MNQPQNNRKIIGFATSAILIAAAAIAFAGPLDPPAGAVSPTSPSLADIQTLIQSQAASTADGPWLVHVIDSRDGTSSQNSSIQIAGGQPVILHSINAYRVSAYAFDGAGVLSGAGTITSGNVVAQVVQSLSPSQYSCPKNEMPCGLTQDTQHNNSNTADFDVLCPNGLEIAWTYDSVASYYIHIYYKLLN